MVKSISGITVGQAFLGFRRYKPLFISTVFYYVCNAGNFKEPSGGHARGTAWHQSTCVLGSTEMASGPEWDGPRVFSHISIDKPFQPGDLLVLPKPPPLTCTVQFTRVVINICDECDLGGNCSAH